MSLQGKRVLVTRAAEEAAELEELLQQRGAVPVRFPCIEFEDGRDVEEIVRALGTRPDLVVVSSPHAARRLKELSTSEDQVFAAVGAATAALLPGKAIIPSRGAGAQALVDELRATVRGKRVLVPRAEDGTRELVDGLRIAGAKVEALTLYRTVTPKSADLSLLRALDAISFASGSAVRGFVSLAGAQAARRCAVACIGGATAAAARDAGIRVDAQGYEGMIGLCDALALALVRSNG